MARASVTPRSFAAGAPTSRRAIARTRSSRWWRRTSCSPSSPPGAELLFARLVRLARRAPGLAPGARRIVVGIRRLLRRPLGGRYVAQVHADARPRRRAAAHRVDQHVVDGEQLRGVGVARLLALEAGQRLVALRRVGDGEERHLLARLLR